MINRVDFEGRVSFDPTIKTGTSQKGNDWIMTSFSLENNDGDRKKNYIKVTTFSIPREKVIEKDMLITITGGQLVRNSYKDKQGHWKSEHCIDANNARIECKENGIVYQEAVVKVEHTEDGTYIPF